MRFRHHQRLRKDYQFKEVKEKGTRIDSGPFLFCIFVVPCTDPLPLRRLGVICSRKVGNAVVRNKIKRQFRDIFRHNQDALPYRCDLSIIAKPFIKDYDYQQLKERFLKCCQRVTGNKNK